MRITPAEEPSVDGAHVWTWWRRAPWLPFQAMNPTGEAVCIDCGCTHPTMEMVGYGNGWVCAGCKPTFFQRIHQGQRPLVGVVYGGFWERVAAKLIDGILLYVIQVPVSMAFGVSLTGQGPTDTAMIMPYLIRVGLMTLVNIGLGVGLTVYFLGRFGATPGKMALKLKVVRPGGEPISYARAFGRYFAEAISSMICGIGYLMVAFDDEKRALHDRIASTRVIKAG